MEPTTPLALGSATPAQCIPYAQASHQQLTKALLFLQEELRLHFPTLPWVRWANALLTLAPDLWAEGDAVYFDALDVSDFAHLLATSPELPQLDPIIYNSRARYLAKRLVNYQDEAIAALADIEANPWAYGPHVYALVTELAMGNAIADEVFEATHRQPQQRPGGPDPAVARAAAVARVRALHGVLGKLGFVVQTSPSNTTTDNAAAAA